MAAPIGGPDAYFTAGLLLIREGPETDIELKELRANVADLAETVGLAVAEVAQRIARNPDLSRKAKAQQLSRLRQERPWLDELHKRFDQTAAIHQARLEAERERLLSSKGRALPPDVDPEAFAAMAPEVREHARGLSEIERSLWLKERYEQADSVSVLAIEQAPEYMDLASPEQLAEGAELFAAARYPEAYALFDQRRAVLDGCEHTYNAVSHHCDRALDRAQEYAGVAITRYVEPFAGVDDA